MPAATLPRRRFLQLASTAFGASMAIGLYAWRWEPHWVELVERPLPLKGLRPDLAGCRMAQLSDLHIGPRVDDDYLRHTFDLVRASAPDLVVYTGDFMSYEADRLAHVRRLFRHLPVGSLGSFGVFGNHDYGPGWRDVAGANRMAELAADAGVQVLRNEVVKVGGLQIGGVDDLWSGRFDPGRVLAQFDPEAAAVVLCHNPDAADLPLWGGYESWILCGHTHGGQCKPPFLPPPLLPVRNLNYQAGEYELSGRRRMYINRGVGHLLQVRFNVRPEVTLFRLERA